MKKLLVLTLMFMMCLTGYAQTRGDTVYVSNVPPVTATEGVSQTDQVLSTILDKSLRMAEKTGQFVMDQAPELLREFYMWHTANHIFFLLLGIILILIGRYVPHLWTSKTESDNYRQSKFFNRYYDDDGFTWGWFGVISIAGILFVIFNLYDLIFILVSPKLYLIEYLLSLRQS